MSDIVERLRALDWPMTQDAAEEIERLRGAYEQERKDCINLTEKVIPNLRAEIERLRELVNGTIDRNSALASDNARLREADEQHRAVFGKIFSALKPESTDRTTWAAEIERLRSENEWFRAAGSTRDAEDQRALDAYKTEVERLRAELERNDPVIFKAMAEDDEERAKLRAEVVEATRRAGRLSSLLRDARADVQELADQQTKFYRIKQYQEQLMEIDKALGDG